MKIPIINGVSTRSERRRRKAQCHYSPLEKAAQERHRQWELTVRNCSISSLRGIEQELADEAIEYQLDIVGLSSTKGEGFGILNFLGWRLLYSGVDITTCIPVLMS
ncbi:unnamed protein product [Soboliphyme baturini]|uniref:Uncharacterized protein n=1 Tax=Soboliphyme baturini TaxID=241478 RepID=A0A183IFU7_9BILA|nr:unnamed protein product [Soboliphyme baturini]